MEYREVIKSVWGDWTIGEKLGEGSFGQVYFVQKERLGVVQKAAVKVVRIPTDERESREVKVAYGFDEKQLRDFFYPEVLKYKQEIQLMQNLGENTNIVQVQDFEIIDDSSGSVGWYILIRMELLESLDVFIRRENIYVKDVLSMALDILGGIKECESQSIIHRDIKVANLFRNKRGIYKLGDFGIARETTVNNRSLSHKGTYNYMAPEVYQGKKYSNNVDLYALGIVMYKLLNKNRLPFLSDERVTSKSLQRAFELRQSGEEVPRAIECSESLHRIIKKMCAYRPEERYQNADEVISDLKSYKITNNDELDIPLSLPKDYKARNIFSVGIEKISKTIENYGEIPQKQGYSKEIIIDRQDNDFEPTLSAYSVSDNILNEKVDSKRIPKSIQPNIQQVLSEVKGEQTSKSVFNKADSYYSYWINYLNFHGKTSRKGYWKALLINGIISFVVNLILLPINEDIASIWNIMWILINIIPDMSVQVRRLRDAGRSPNHILWHITSLIVFLLGVLFILLYVGSSLTMFVYAGMFFVFLGMFTKIPIFILLLGKGKKD